MEIIELTVKEFAAKERVTVRTVWNWRAKGAIAFRKTPGGGIRIIDRTSSPRLTVLGVKPSENFGNSSR